MNRRFTHDDKIALLMHGHLATGFGKLGHGMLRYSDANIVAIIDEENAGKDARDVTRIARSVPVVGSVEDAAKLGAQILIVGIAPPGGKLPASWWQQLETALEHGMSLVNPLHDPWNDVPSLAERLDNGRFIWDIRVEPQDAQPGTGKAAQMSTPRVLTVGSDMSVGKMTAGLELVASARKAGLDARFVATGQVGICITGAGVALDAVRLDYVTGVIETEVLKNADADFIVIEGQGALCHPASTATLALMRGSMPTHLLFVHRARQTSLSRMPEFSIPDLPALIALNENLAAACGTFPKPKTIGIALNTADISDAEALDEIAKVSTTTGLPTTDPVRFGAEVLLRPLVHAVK